ncbi:MFS transporter [Haloarchaeobius sp. DFWS5]|uniref:MFS transporter n=1 Tax=Haloarchaeobius sp. DFWS5 TaxID=3446114 RepID=UPI003EBE19FB
MRDFALPERLSVLRNPGFRRLLAGRSVSVLGDGLYSVAAMWLVFELTGSSAYTGIAGFLTGIPGLFSVLVGPIVDRSELDRVLTLSEVAQGVVVLVVPLAWLTGNLTVWVVLVTMPILSAVGLFANPAQTAAVPRLVPSESLVRANAAASSVRQAVSALARGVGGALIAVVGAVGVYLIDAVTFVVAALTFASLSVPGPRTDGGEEDGNSEEFDDNEDDVDGDADASFDLESYLTELREGVAIVTGSILGRMVLAVLFANFTSSAAFAVLPAFSEELGGAGMYGLILAGFTVGNVVGSLFSSTVESIPLGRTTIVGMSTAGILFAAGIWVASPVVTLALVTVSRVPVGMYNVSVIATLQSGVPDDKLGRVSSAISSGSNLVSPLGLLVGGFLGDIIGAWTVLLASGAGSVIMAMYWLVVPSLRNFEPPTNVEPGSFG